MVCHTKGALATPIPLITYGGQRWSGEAVSSVGYRTPMLVDGHVDISNRTLEETSSQILPPNNFSLFVYHFTQ